MILYRQLRVNKLVFVRRQKMTEKEMQAAATRFLKMNGCGWDGRKELDPKQTRFERSKMKPSPMGGQPPRR